MSTIESRLLVLETYEKRFDDLERRCRILELQSIAHTKDGVRMDNARLPVSDSSTLTTEEVSRAAQIIRSILTLDNDRLRDAENSIVDGEDTK